MDLETLFSGKERFVKNIVLKSSDISFSEFIAVTNFGAKVDFSNQYIERVNTSCKNLDVVTKKSKIYGVNTGLGSNCEQPISEKQEEIFQQNILRSHAVAVGRPLSFIETRAVMLMVLLNLGQGYSGVSIEVLETIKALLNKKIYPYAPSEGSVGYLSIEAHIFLILIGEGKVFINGNLENSKKGLKEKGIKTIKLRRKEALSLISGSTSVTATAVLTIYNAYINLKNIEIGAALSFEGLHGSMNELDLNSLKLKNHSEQVETACFIRKMLENSQNLNSAMDLKVQDPLSIRTLPQEIGAFKRIFKETIESVQEEMNGVSDNPVVIRDGENIEIRMNGNFDASYVSLHMNALSIATAALANSIERISNRFLDPKLSGLPPFLVKNSGLNNGLMIVHYTLAGLLNEIHSLAEPSNISNNTMSAEQEDTVTFAYTVSKRSYKISEKLKYIIAIWFFISKEGLHFIKKNELSPVMKEIINLIDTKVPVIRNDRFFYKDIQNLKYMLDNLEIINVTQNIVKMRSNGNEK